MTTKITVSMLLEIVTAQAAAITALTAQVEALTAKVDAMTTAKVTKPAAAVVRPAQKAKYDTVSPRHRQSVSARRQVSPAP